MKFYFLLPLIAFTLNANSQGRGLVDISVNTGQSFYETQTELFNRGTYLNNTNEEEDVEGSIFLFDDFDNLGVLKTKEQDFILKNINIDVLNNNVVSKISKDSLFVFNNIDNFIINNKAFTKLENKIYEVIYESNKFDLLKLNYKKKKKEVRNRMTNEIVSTAKWIINDDYFLMDKNSSLERVKLKNLLERITKDKQENKKVNKFMKKNKLKMKSILDLKKILTYHNSL